MDLEKPGTRIATRSIQPPDPKTSQKIALLAPHEIDVYQMIIGSHNAQFFLDSITLVNKFVKLNYPTGNNIIILGNCVLPKEGNPRYYESD